MTLIQADATNLPYPDKFFHACVTSPPYWGLRKYSGDQGRAWGGNPDCEHRWGEKQIHIPAMQTDFKNSGLKNDGRPEAARLATNLKSSEDKEGQANPSHSMFCQKCNAWYGGLGLEPTPEMHIQHMVEVFREVRRVLRDDGVVWLNYGDCFAGGGRGKSDTPKQASNKGHGDTGHGYRGIEGGSLMLMPHRLAIALQQDGWIVRNDLVWFKRNPMPESVAGWRWERRRNKTKAGNTSVGQLDREQGKASWTVFSGKGTRRKDLDNPEYEYSDDYVLRKSSWRHTRSHEYVFQLVKSMGYYCNQEVVREPHKEPWRSTGAKEKGAVFAYEERKPAFDKREYNPGGRNPRSVLDVPTAPYKGAHYATFPPKLIAPLIRASVPRRCCPECGMAWAPVVERGFERINDISKKRGQRNAGGNKRMYAEGGWGDLERGRARNSISDYRPTCECGVTEHNPGIVLDIFGGSGTTGMVAKELLRRWVVMDISRPYLDEQAKVRTGTGTPSKALDGLPMFEEME